MQKRTTDTGGPCPPSTPHTGQFRFRVLFQDLNQLPVHWHCFWSTWRFSCRCGN